MINRGSVGVDPAAQRNLPPLLRQFQHWTVTLFCISVAFHVVARLVFHLHGHMVYPYSMNKIDRFSDFTIFTDKFRLFHTEQFFQVGFPINYPAPVCVLFEVFFRFLAPHELLAFVTFSCLSFAVPAVLFGRAMVRRGISAGNAVTFAAVGCLLSWPIALIVDRGNAEVFVWLALLIGMWALATGHKYSAAVFFGIAASMKLFPIALLALFLRKGRLKYAAAGVASFAVVSVASLKILGPTVAIAYRGIAYGLNSFKVSYMGEWRMDENGVDHSIFAFVKGVMAIVFHHKTLDFMNALNIYLYVMAVAGLLLFFLRIRKMPILNQVLSLSIICIFFTAFSGDATLAHLYYPLAMLIWLVIKAARGRIEVPGLRLIMACMLLCTATTSFFVIPWRIIWAARFIGPIHAIFLGVMLSAALYYPLGPSLSEDGDEIILSRPSLDWAVQGTYLKTAEKTALSLGD